jgi:hypothetical protein
VDPGATVQLDRNWVPVVSFVALSTRGLRAICAEEGVELIGESTLDRRVFPTIESDTEGGNAERRWLDSLVGALQTSRTACMKVGVSRTLALTQAR